MLSFKNVDLWFCLLYTFISFFLESVEIEFNKYFPEILEEKKKDVIRVSKKHLKISKEVIKKKSFFNINRANYSGSSESLSYKLELENMI